MSEHTTDGFGQHYRDYWSRIMAYVRSRTRSQTDAEDVVQETFLKAWNSKVSGSPGQITAQLLKIASSTLIDQNRSSRARNSREQKVAEARPQSEDSHDAAQHSEQLQSLQEAIAELSPRTREVLILHRLKHLSHREIASELKISVSMVEKHLIKAMRHCRQKLKRFQ